MWLLEKGDKKNFENMAHVQIKEINQAVILQTFIWNEVNFFFLNCFYLRPSVGTVNPVVAEKVGRDRRNLAGSTPSPGSLWKCEQIYQCHND